MKDRGNFVIVNELSQLPSSDSLQYDENGTLASNTSTSSSARRSRRKLPVPCALRIEVMGEGGELIRCSHGSSEAFSGLDDKDELVRTFQRCRCEELEITPPSRLISWDVTKEECSNLVGQKMPVLASSKGTEDTVAVLKEPMGSRGTGIFFVKDADEIHEIIERHRKQAVEEPNFLDNLISAKGRIPSWGKCVGLC